MVIKVLIPGRKLLLQSMLLLRRADSSTLLEPLTTSHRYLNLNDRPSALAVRPQLSQDGVPTIDGRNSPRQRQHVTPMTVRMKQRLEQGVVAIAQRSLQLSKPTLGDC